ncbi:unnamed protein product [Discula destructiva]
MPFPFTVVCDLLQDLENNQNRKRPGRSNIRITKDWFTEHRDLIHGPAVDSVALLSTLLPERRTDRVFFIKEKSLERIVSSACGLGTRKELLRRWETAPRAGLDFAECVEDILRQSPNDGGQEINVEEINSTLQQLASNVSFSSPAIRSSCSLATPRVSNGEHLLASLFRRLPPRDAKWFCRVVLKNFEPVIVPEATVYSSFHPLLPTVLKIHDDFAVAVKLLQEHLSAYQARGLSLNKANILRIIEPQVGVKVGRQQWLKARGIKHCLAMGTGWMSCEAKIDGEYCQIHIDLSKGQSSIQIFSKSGKDSTMDRIKLHPAIKAALRLDTPQCKFTKRCILEGELVVYNEFEKKIAGFEKIRKHVTRSGRYIGTCQDSQAHTFEHLMIVFFDVLLVDDDSMLKQCHSERRKRLSSLIYCQEGQAALVESRLINFSISRVATKELREVFASCILRGEEGLVLKPDEPYFSFGIPRRNYDSCCLKLKKGYIQGLGDAGDFAVVGARHDPTTAKALGLSNIKFTHFYLGCLTNREMAIRFQAKPIFRMVNEVQLNPTMAEYFQRHVFVMDVLPEDNDKLIIEAPQSIGKGKKVTAVFLEPAVFDMTCFNFHKEGNTNFWSLRHPYVSKVHTDRSWKDCVTFDELQNLAKNHEASIVDDDSQELLEWIDKLEKSESKRRGKGESQTTDTTRNTPGTSTTGASRSSRTQSPAQTTAFVAAPVLVSDTDDPRCPIISDISAPARSTETPEQSSLSQRKRRRDNSPVAIRHARAKTKVIDLTLSPPPSTTSQRSLRQPLEDITSTASSQGNALLNFDPRLLKSKTTQKEPKTAKSSPMPARLPHAASLGTASAFSSTRKSTTNTSDALSTPTRPGAPPMSSSALPTCRHAGATCALAGSFILLSPCIANVPLLRETLLPSHGVRAVFQDMASWHASVNLPSSSSAKSMRLVLVETKRKDETKKFLRELVAEPLRLRNGGVERVIAYDWRLIEAITNVEQVQRKSDGSGTRQKVETGAHAKELWRRHYAGVC